MAVSQTDVRVPPCARLAAAADGRPLQSAIAELPARETASEPFMELRAASIAADGSSACPAGAAAGAHYMSDTILQGTSAVTTLVFEGGYSQKQRGKDEDTVQAAIVHTLRAQDEVEGVRTVAAPNCEEAGIAETAAGAIAENGKATLAKLRGESDYAAASQATASQAAASQVGGFVATEASVNTEPNTTAGSRARSFSQASEPTEQMTAVGSADGMSDSASLKERKGTRGHAKTQLKPVAKGQQKAATPGQQCLQDGENQGRMSANSQMREKLEQRRRNFDLAVAAEQGAGRE